MQGLAQIGWDSMVPMVCSGVFGLAGVYLGYRLQRGQAGRQTLRDARYRLLVLLRQLQVQVATAVDRCNRVTQGTGCLDDHAAQCSHSNSACSMTVCVAFSCLSGG